MSFKKVVLYVEDDPNDVLLVQQACRNAKVSFEIEVVKDGEAAIEYLSGADIYSDRQRHPLPEMIMLDLKMPRQSGFEVLQWIRGQPCLKHLPVVVFSSSKHEGDMKRAYDSGANSYMVKPVGFDSLVKMVKTINLYWLTLNQTLSSIGSRTPKLKL
jgi:CheY-like chemotaxis protein